VKSKPDQEQSQTIVKRKSLPWRWLGRVQVG
jgi:hypothetical protein